MLTQNHEKYTSCENGPILVDDKKHQKKNTNNRIAIMNNSNQKLVLGLFTREELESDLRKLRDGESVDEINEKYSNLRITQDESPRNENYDQMLKTFTNKANLSFYEIV